MFLSRGDRDLGVAFQTHPGRQAFISSGSKEPRSALESRRVPLGAHWVDSRESRHITIGDHAIVGGLSGIHQFVRIGAYAMVGGCCALGQDLPPFMRAAGGYRARMYGLNSIGLRRHGFSAERISALKQAYELLFRSGHRVGEAVKLARATFKKSQDVMQVADFMEGTKRGICRSVGKEQEGDEE